MPRWVKDLLIAVLIICGGIYLLLFIGSTSPRVQAPAQTPVYSSVPVGSEGQLRSGGSVIPVAIDEDRGTHAGGVSTLNQYRLPEHSASRRCSSLRVPNKLALRAWRSGRRAPASGTDSAWTGHHPIAMIGTTEW